MISAVVTMMVAAGVLAAWKALPGLLIGRLLTGASGGLAAGTAITYLLELRLRADPKAPIGRARTIGTSINVGALGIGPLLAGLLAQWGKLQLTLPYLVILGLGAIALGQSLGRARDGCADATSVRHIPKSTRPVLARRGSPSPLPPGRSPPSPQTGCSRVYPGCSWPPPFTAPPTHWPAPRSFSCSLPASCPSWRRPSCRPSRVLLTGTLSMLAGLVLLVVSVRLTIPNLALFLVGGALIGAGSGAVFKGTTGIVLETSAPENRLHMTADLLIALFVGLSVPVVGAGIALNEGASSSNTVLGFAILVGLGVSVSGWALLGRRSKGSAQGSSLSRSR